MKTMAVIRKSLPRNKLQFCNLLSSLLDCELGWQILQNHVTSREHTAWEKCVSVAPNVLEWPPRKENTWACPCDCVSLRRVLSLQERIKYTLQLDSSVESVSRSAEILLQASYGPQKKALPISMIPFRP